MSTSSRVERPRWCTLSPLYVVLLVPAILIYSFVSSAIEESKLVSNDNSDSETGEISSAVSSDITPTSLSSSTAEYDNNNENTNTGAQLLPNCKRAASSKGDGQGWWSEREFPISSVKSYFNCFLDDTLCTYYYPADFFDANCGIGREYIKFTEEAEAMRKNRTLWNFMPSVGFPTLTLQDTCTGEYKQKKEAKAFSLPSKSSMRSPPISRNLPKKTLKNIGLKTYSDDEHGNYTCMTERLTMLHVHKAGGSSLHEAFNHISKDARSSTALVRHKFFTPSQRPVLEIKGPNKNENKPNVASHYEDFLYNFTLESLTHATKYPEESYEPQQHVIFAVVRDPVDRFISSIGQALGAKGSTGNQIGKKLRQVCVDGASTPGEALKCIAKYVQKHGFWIELHFTPQVIDISFTTLFTDVPIAIFSFRNLSTVLDYFGAGGVQLRNGKAENYRSSPVLRNMTASDYDKETLKIVCEIYEMDVIMQRSLGMEVERCDPFIPK
eukprot:CAMPEP_0203658368 /NCGR_PEP_ID=MMETSP0088-20131115/48047_1 /ASSEMBLY_ACC=CAM_ASM_001087 /TAXON_ID=426623 /ORGANISM="Chaetoceros affinis, Strain CCMP159" /LENGTH=495 /DNA_ID=CAMNT_0050520015 /DNA_START=37 /DNA_END=1524 /DNA_ORIENTATION=+